MSRKRRGFHQIQQGCAIVETRLTDISMVRRVRSRSMGVRVAMHRVIGFKFRIWLLELLVTTAECHCSEVISASQDCFRKPRESHHSCSVGP